MKSPVKGRKAGGRSRKTSTSEQQVLVARMPKALPAEDATIALGIRRRPGVRAEFAEQFPPDERSSDGRGPAARRSLKRPASRDAAVGP